MNELGDTTRVGLLEMRLKAQSIRLKGFEAKFDRVERELKELQQENQDKQSDVNLGMDEKSITESISSLIDGFVSLDIGLQAPDERPVFTADKPGLYSFASGFPIALEADDEYDLSGYALPVFVRYLGEADEDDSDPETPSAPIPEVGDPKHPGCSVDVLCTDCDGDREIGYYSYDGKCWHYPASPGVDHEPVKWQWLPE